MSEAKTGGRPDLALVVAVAENGVIGHRGAMPWHLPADLAHFRQLTTGHPVLMGRSTFEAIGRPLPHRRNLVLTRRPDYATPGCETFGTLAAALEAVDSEHTYVIGGADVFAQTEHLARELHLTRVHAGPDGDTVLSLDLSTWHLASSVRRPADADNAHDCTFSTYERLRR